MTEVEDPKSAWFKKGATLSDKSARKEFGLSQEEIIESIRGGKLHYHENSVFTNKNGGIIWVVKKNAKTQLIMSGIK